jgi:flagellar M-ring protein FliF
VLEPLPTPAPTDMDRKRAEIGSLAERDPARTAEVLRGLMDDRQRA